MNAELKEILIELQEQNGDLLSLLFDLTIEYNSLNQKLNEDFYKIYNEIYNAKSLQEAKEFLDNKKFHLTSRNERIDNRNKNIVVQYQKRHDCMLANLEKIETLP